MNNPGDAMEITSPKTPVVLSITIPAYREAENLAIMLPSIREAAAALAPSYEVLVVDTQEPMDNGDAIRTIIAEANGDYILCMDADGSHSPAYFASMWAQRENYDIVIGSRYAPGGHTENPAILILMSYVLNLTFRISFSIRAKDVTNSFRLYRRGILTFLRLESNDFDILEELLIKVTLRKPPARIAEVPVTFGRRKAGESKRKLVQFAFGYLKTLKRLRSFAAAARKENAAQ